MSNNGKSRVALKSCYVNQPHRRHQLPHREVRTTTNHLRIRSGDSLSRQATTPTRTSTIWRQKKMQRTSQRFKLTSRSVATTESQRYPWYQRRRCCCRKGMFPLSMFCQLLSLRVGIQGKVSSVLSKKIVMSLRNAIKSQTFLPLLGWLNVKCVIVNSVGVREVL